MLEYKKKRGILHAMFERVIRAKAQQTLIYLRGYFCAFFHPFPQVFKYAVPIAISAVTTTSRIMTISCLTLIL